MDSNHYLDTNNQKAFQSHIAGCEEHQLKLASVIKYANQHQWSLAIAWLDLANSYGRLTTNSFSLRQMESLDITPLDLVSKPETMSQGGTKPYLWQPVITSPVIQQRMEEPVWHTDGQAALSHYQAPAEFLTLVSNQYENLQAVITCTQWETYPVNLLVGIFQGDPYQFQSSHRHQLTAGLYSKCLP